MKDFRRLLKFPLETTKVKVGIGGTHYHLPGCPVANPLSFTYPEHYDYMETEVPKVLIDQEADINYLGKTYHTHIDICKELIRRKAKP